MGPTKGIGAPKTELRITTAMFRAGVAAFQKWRPEQEEIECLVAEMFYSMLDAAAGDGAEIPNSARMISSNRPVSCD